MTLDDFPGGGEMGALVRSLDWSTTALGPTSAWPVSLKTLVRTILHAKQPMIVWWGPELVQVYNDAMLASTRGDRSLGMGQPGHDAWRHDDASWSSSPVFDDEGNRAGILTIGVARRELERAREQTSRLKDEFIATVSHELRTPLTAMLGWAQLLRSDQLPESRRRHAIETIERNARLESRLVDDLLDIGRLASGKLRLVWELLLLAPLVEVAVDALRATAQARRVRLHATLNPTLTVRGDVTRLQQIVTNLVSNAIKFSEPGGEVNVTLAIAGANAELIVADHGAGIDAAFLPHVFDRFRQADAATNRAHGGLGLGLALVKRLVELHEGTVVAESEGRGRGATLRVMLPLSKNRPVDDGHGAGP